MKPEDLVSKRIRPTRINDYVIDRVEIDLRHINYGLDQNKNYRKRKRSNLSTNEVISFFESLYEIELEFDSDDAFDYFLVEKNFFKALKRYRMVFCVEKEKPKTSGIITLFQLNEDEL